MLNHTGRVSSSTAMNARESDVVHDDLFENQEQEAHRILFLGGTVNEWEAVAAHLKDTFKSVEPYCLEGGSLTEFRSFEDCLAVVIDFELWTKGPAGIPAVFKERYPALPMLLCVNPERLEPALNELGSYIDDYVVKGEGYELLLGRRIQWLRSRLIRREAERAHVTRLFQQAQKLEALGVLAGGFAHKFNNVLTAVLGYTQMSIAALPRGAGRDNLLHVMEAGTKAKDLVRQLASLSHLREGASQKVPVGTIVKETLKSFRVSVPSTIQIKEHLATTPVGWDTVLCDPVHFYQILSNLCTNALSAIMASSYGTLQVKLFPHNIREGEATAFSHLKSGRYVALQVHASCKGIEKDLTVRRLDSPSTSEQAHFEMGLAIVRKLVDDYGGDVDIDRSPNDGATVTVLLPAVEVLATRGGTDTGAPMPTGSEHILLVDDEEMVVHVGSRMLEKLGYKVTSFVDSRQALDFFRSNPAAVDLLLTDLTMPEMNGLDLAAGIFSSRPDMPVIVCTGYTDDLAVEKMKKMGLEALIRKPFIIKLLATTVRDTLDRRQGRE